MPLQVVRNPSLADQVFEQLVSAILTLQYPAGSLLPAERKLVETFGVNRHVVREALKRLEQIRLVKVTQGGGTRVLDFKRHAGLDLLALLAEHANAREHALSYWLSVHEMRATIAADGARLCAIRASSELKQELLAISQRMRDQADGPDLFALDLRFWENVLEGASNIAYRLAFNTLVQGVTAAPIAELARVWGLYELQQCNYRVPIAGAIAAGDAARAESLACASMRPIAEALAKQLGVGVQHAVAPETRAPEQTGPVLKRTSRLRGRADP